jgi:16S rRNA (cytosine1402-N4)-methyltransferase
MLNPLAMAPLLGFGASWRAAHSAVSCRAVAGLGGGSAHSYGTEYHTPVACAEVVQWLVTDKNGLYVDCTLGGGGHSHAMLDFLNPGGQVIGVDQDPEALEFASSRLEEYVKSGQFVALNSNFSRCENAVLRCARSRGQSGVQGMLFDLGVSSHQLDCCSRGFSFREEGPLDMRMEAHSGGPTAADLCNTLEETALRDIIYRLGEERRSTRIAASIVRARPLRTTADLASAIESAVPVLHERKSKTRVFQALRMQVNGELPALEGALQLAQRLIVPGGRIVIMSYHSLEDRRVKRVLATGNLRGQVQQDEWGDKIIPWRPLTRKPLVPSEGEVARNPRARSAKIRVAERTTLPAA